jgi:hypothetical protein
LAGLPFHSNNFGKKIKQKRQQKRKEKKKKEKGKKGKERKIEKNFQLLMYNVQLCIVLSLSCQLHSQLIIVWTPSLAAFSFALKKTSNY